MGLAIRWQIVKKLFAAFQALQENEEVAKRFIKRVELNVFHFY
jgi:hypothetical protein